MGRAGESNGFSCLPILCVSCNIFIINQLLYFRSRTRDQQQPMQVRYEQVVFGHVHIVVDEIFIREDNVGRDLYMYGDTGKKCSGVQLFRASV